MAIIPPPTLKVIIDKTAAFVAKNGKSAEKKIIARNKTEESKKKFAFLKDTNPFYAYYRQEVDKLAFAIYNTQKKPVEKEVINNVTVKESIVEKKVVAAVEQKAKIKSFVELKEKEEVEDLGFILSHPTMSDFTTTSDKAHKQIELVKLTAQTAAVLGQSFIDKLLRRVDSIDFDFLRNGHRLNSYFVSLVDSYLRIIDSKERENLILNLTKSFKSREEILQTALQRVEKKKKEIQIQRETLSEEDQMNLQQIDWHDFVIVGTIDFGTAEEKTIVEESEEEDEDEIEMESDEEEVVKKMKVMLPNGEIVGVNEINDVVKVDLIDPNSRVEKQKFLERQRTKVISESQIAKNLKALHSNKYQ